MSKHNKKDKFPLRTEILALTPAEQHTAICEYIHSSLVQSFADKHTQLDYGNFCTVIEELGIQADDVNAATDTLFKNFKKDFNIHFYYFEEKIESINGLALVVNKNIIDLFSPPSSELASKPFFSEKYWPWKMGNVEKNIDKSNEDITFVLSCPRSGSTIFRLILAAHPQLFSPPELHLLPFNSMGSRAEEINKNGFEWMKFGVAEALMEAEGIKRKEALKAVNTMAANDMPVVDVYRHLQEKIGDRVLVDKTPFYSCHPQWLKRAATMFPKAKFIFLTRHPVGMINSFVKLRLKELTHNSFGCYSENPWHLGEKWWLTGNKNINDFVESLSKPRSLFLRYEDLVSDTHSSMSDVCNFMNVPFNEKILNPYAETDKNTTKGIGDPNIMNHSTIDASMADSWKTQNLPHPLSSQSIELANQLGYHFDV